MKRMTALILALIMALSLAACGGDNTSSDNNTPAGPSGTNNEVSLDKEIILIDNENVTITATAKFEEKKVNANGYHEVGYRVLIENHSDQYIIVSYDQLSVDGFMIDGHGMENMGKLNPQTKVYSSLSIYVDETTSNKTVETMDDLRSIDGTIKVSHNTDGSLSYGGPDWGGAFHID